MIPALVVSVGNSCGGWELLVLVEMHVIRGETEFWIALTFVGKDAKGREVPRLSDKVLTTSY